MELSGHSIKFTSLGQTVWAWKSSKKSCGARSSD